MRAASRLCLTLLPVGDAWPPALQRTPVRSYRTVSPSPPFGGTTLLCGPLPAGYPAPGVTRHRALWRADFPRPRPKAGRDCPAHLNTFSIIARNTFGPSLLKSNDTLKGEILTTRHRGWIALMALGLAVLACSNLPGNGGTNPPLPTTALLPTALLSGRVRRQPPRRRSGERCQPAVKEWPILFLCALRTLAVNPPQMRKSTGRRPGRRRG